METVFLQIAVGKRVQKFHAAGLPGQFPGQLPQLRRPDADDGLRRKRGEQSALEGLIGDVPQGEQPVPDGLHNLVHSHSSVYLAERP